MAPRFNLGAENTKKPASSASAECAEVASASARSAIN
jgi:hypothetical protein